MCFLPTINTQKLPKEPPSTLAIPLMGPRSSLLVLPQRCPTIHVRFVGNTNPILTYLLPQLLLVTEIFHPAAATEGSRNLAFEDSQPAPRDWIAVLEQANRLPSPVHLFLEASPAQQGALASLAAAPVAYLKALALGLGLGFGLASGLAKMG